MKLKEINRTAIQSWSPAQHHPIYLATGTSAQQLDASFSTNASLEFFELDLGDPSLDMKSCGILSSTHRYHQLVWGPFGMDSQGYPSGVLIAGGENGNVILYDAAKIMAGESDVIIAESDRHTGPVRALDVNHFQTNLVASGGNESEIYIWDMNNFGSPMTPGPKAQPQEDINCVAWNKQVQHILASASPSGRTSVWDLRKNDLIIKVSDHSNRMRCSGLAWNPEVATQLVLASEDDRLPVIQMWDLRFATSPLKILEHHTRGVLAIAWSLADPELLLSCGKDSRILCWNPNTGEVLYEMPTSSQWCFDIQWCPRNPAVLSAACFDGHIDIYSIMGGSSQAQSQRHADQISNSFGNMDPFGTGQTLPPLQLPQTTTTPTTVNPLKKPPKWICRPVGASFAFGGKLVSMENTKPQQHTSHVVHISQVVTETAFLERSSQLQATLSSGSFVGFCQEKISAAGNEFERTVWSFLKVNFESDVRSKYLELLGYDKEEVALKISAALEEKPPDIPQVDSSASLQPLADLSLAPPADNPEAAFDLIAATLQLDSTPDPDSEEPAEPGVFNSELDTNVDQEEDEIDEKQEEEGEIPLNEELIAQVEVEESSPVKTPAEIPPPVPTPAGGVHLSVSQDVDGLITQALLTGDFEGAVELCLHDNRMADSIILAIAGGADLLVKTQKKYFNKANSKITKLISAVVMKDWHDILKTCDLQNWREALAAVMTYAQPEDFSSLCDLLGSRLEAAEDPQLQSQACLCYICAGNVEKLVSCWSRAQDGHCPISLQDLVEKVVVLRRAVELTQLSGPAAIGILLAEKMSQYANLLASQGSLSTAITYLPENTNQVAVQQLRDRLFQALGQQTAPALAHRAASQLPNCPTQHGSALPQPPFSQVQAMVPQPTAGAPAPGSTPGSTPSQPQYYQPVGPLNPVYGLPASSTPAAPSASSTPAYMYSCQYQRPQNGWNDPPALTRAPKKKQVTENYTPPAPITAPILTPLGADPQTQPMSSGAPQAMVQGLHNAQVPYSGMHQTQLSAQTTNPTMANSNMEGAPGAPTGDAIQPLHSIPAEKIMKKPIPDEHLVLKTTFEGLIQRCLAVATDPQTKRKLDDANKRLEALYDKLREQTLSPAIVGGLHNIARTIDSRSYTEGLNIHTHIVSNSNFSETSAFMPVLKVVLTQANKLGV
ncbi:protein transport protein Sec31A isoform X4 [Girardinichthys multiradiatus]|uniref:protein transport protein Sec31A isoform X4 n=1 Tax=Girardinichthys multiradiatus TaxID=208333 RepID=UPI001FABB2F2|nr:protein transport protein Sec31A isoform X4 [Girardinichthys multiradiatus]